MYGDGSDRDAYMVVVLVMIVVCMVTVALLASGGRGENGAAEAVAANSPTFASSLNFVLFPSFSVLILLYHCGGGCR